MLRADVSWGGSLAAEAFRSRKALHDAHWKLAASRAKACASLGSRRKSKVALTQSPAHLLSDAPLQCAVQPARWLLCCAPADQRAGQRPLPRTKRSFGISEMDKIALGQAAAATMRDMVHALQPLDAGHVVAIGKGKQRLAERQQKRVLRLRRRRAVGLGMRSVSKMRCVAAVRPAAMSAIIA